MGKKKVALDVTWSGRRLVIRLTLLACLLESVYALYKGPELTIAAFPWLVGLAGSVVGSYVFGSSWERVSGVPSFNSYQEHNQSTYHTQVSRYSPRLGSPEPYE